MTFNDTDCKVLGIHVLMQNYPAGMYVSYTISRVCACRVASVHTRKRAMAAKYSNQGTQQADRINVDMPQDMHEGISYHLGVSQHNLVIHM